MLTAKLKSNWEKTKRDIERIEAAWPTLSLQRKSDLRGRLLRLRARRRELLSKILA